MHLLQPAFLEKKSRHFVMDHVPIIHSQIRNMFEMFSAEYGQVCVDLFTHDQGAKDRKLGPRLEKYEKF